VLNADTSRLVAEVQALRQCVSELEKSQLEHERMEKALKESEEKYRTIFESANDALILLGKKGKILDVNKKLTDASGYDKAELVEKQITSLTKIMSKKSLAVVAKNFVKRIVGIEIPPYEVEMINKSGELMNVEINAVAVRKDGRIVGDLAILRDVTERKRAEEILQESEEKYRDLFENTNDLIQSVTPEGRFRYVNNAWRKTLGYSEEDVSNLTIFDIIHRDYLQHCEMLFQKLMSGEDIGPIEAAFISKNGDKIMIEGNVNCRFMDGKPVYTRGIFRNITERKRVEEQMLRLASAVWMSTNSIIITDLDSKIVDVNEAALKMYGTDSREDLIGKSFLALIVPTRRETVLEDIREVLEKGYGKDREYHFISNDGHEVPVEMKSSLVKSADGKSIGFVRVGIVSSECK